MKAYRLEDGLLEVREKDESGEEKRLRNSPLFKRFEAGLAWPHLLEQEHYSRHWLIVVGEQEDGVLSYFVEESGDLETIGQKAIEWKDRLLLSRIYTSDEHKESLQALRDPQITDGLCMYGSDGDGELSHWHKRDYWPHFRDYRTYCPIIIVPKSVQGNILAGYQTIRRLLNADEAVYRNDIQIFRQIVTQGGPLQDLLTHPLMKAAVWVTTMMERDQRAMTEEEIEEPTPWYDNPRRD